MGVPQRIEGQGVVGGPGPDAVYGLYLPGSAIPASVLQVGVGEVEVADVGVTRRIEG